MTNDVIPCLSTPEHPSPIDLAAYRDVVLERFGNPAIRDSNQRVAMDGYSKIPGFIAPTVRERLAKNASIASVAMLPALFLAFLQRWHRGRDPVHLSRSGDGPRRGARHLRVERPGGRVLSRHGALGSAGRRPSPGARDSSGRASALPAFVQEHKR